MRFTCASCERACARRTVGWQTKMEEGEFFAIETFGSTGKGIVHEVAAGPAQRGREGGWERRREERERNRERQTDRDREREKERQTDRQTDRERERERERESVHEFACTQALPLLERMCLLKNDARLLSRRPRRSLDVAKSLKKKLSQDPQPVFNYVCCAAVRKSEYLGSFNKNSR